MIGGSVIMGEAGYLPIMRKGVSYLPRHVKGAEKSRRHTRDEAGRAALNSHFNISTRIVGSLLWTVDAACG